MSTHVPVQLPLSSSSALPVELVHTRASYRPDIDGLRAVAVLAVIGDHTGVVPGGSVGVDIFFVISGYLISGIILRSLGAGTFSFVDFYARRVRRIFPALTLVLATLLVLGWLLLLNDEYRLLGKDVAIGATFLMNCVQWVFPDPNVNQPRMLPHLWSLSVEEQFYLVWPLFLCATWRWARQYFLGVVLLVAAASLCVDIVWAPLQTVATAYAASWTRVWQLSLGCALACAEMVRAHSATATVPSVRSDSFSWLRLFGPHARGLLGVALLTISFTCITGVYVEEYPAVWKLPVTAGAVLLVSAGSQGWVNRHVLSAPPIVFIGLISYPLYLWHFPLLEILRLQQRDVTPTMMAATISAAILLSIATYKYVEIPLRSPGRRARKTLFIVAGLAACGIGGYLVFLGLAPARPLPNAIGNIVAATTEPTWSASKDSSTLRGSSSRYVLYVGDSNMAQYYPRIDRLLTERPLNPRSAIFAVRDGCAPGTLEPFDVNVDEAACGEFLRHIAERAARADVEAVVFGASWYRSYRNYPGDLGPLRPQAELAFRDLQHAITSLVEAGKRVYLILNIPVDAKFDPHRMIRRTLVPGGFTSLIETPRRADVAAAIEPISTRLREIAKLAGATVIDPTESLCDSASCRVIAADGIPIYRDKWHLRPSYAREYASFIDETLLGPSPEEGTR